MPVYGKVVVIRRNGSDGSQFPITSNSCLFGRSQDCDIRVQLPYVSNEQCRISMAETGEFVLQNISKSNKTMVNNKSVSSNIKLSNEDIITVVDRSFRFEYPENSAFFKKSDQSKGFEPNSQTDSPFGKLVHEMKTMIKSTNTPLRQRNDKKKSSTKKESKPTKKKNLENNAQGSLSVNMLNVALIEKYASSDSAESVKDKDAPEQRKGKRLSGQRSSSVASKSPQRKPAKLAVKSPKSRSSTSLAQAEKVVGLANNSLDSSEKENIAEPRQSKRLSGQRSSSSVPSKSPQEKPAKLVAKPPKSRSSTSSGQPEKVVGLVNELLDSSEKKNIAEPRLSKRLSGQRSSSVPIKSSQGKPVDLAAKSPKSRSSTSLAQAEKVVGLANNSLDSSTEKENIAEPRLSKRLSGQRSSSVPSKSLQGKPVDLAAKSPKSRSSTSLAQAEKIVGLANNSLDSSTEKENIAEPRQSKRLSGQRSSSVPSKSLQGKPVDLAAKSPKSRSSTSLAQAEKVVGLANNSLDSSTEKENKAEPRLSKRLSGQRSSSVPSKSLQGKPVDLAAKSPKSRSSTSLAQAEKIVGLANNSLDSSTEKENKAEPRQSKRLSGQRSSSVPSKSLQGKPVDLAAKSPKSRSSTSLAQAEKVVGLANNSLDSSTEKENIAEPRQSKRLSGQRSSSVPSKSPQGKPSKLSDKSSNPKSSASVAKAEEVVALESNSLDSFAKENIAEKRQSKRVSGRRSSEGKNTDMILPQPLVCSPEAMTRKSPKSAQKIGKTYAAASDFLGSVELENTIEQNKSKKSPRRRSSFGRKLETTASQQEAPTSSEKEVKPDNSESQCPATVVTSKTRRRSEPAARRATKKQVASKKKIPRKRASLPLQSGQAQMVSTAFSDKELQDSSNNPRSNVDNESIGSSINSSASVGILNEGMITESLSLSESSESSVYHSKTSRRSSRSSLGNPKSTSVVETPEALQKVATNTTPTSVQESTPNISLTPSNVTPMPAEDPYSFPEEDSTEKVKKYRRRSSGSTGLSRKQTLLLFGSPRNKLVTPLRRSIGKLRQSSEPLMEDANETTSPKQSAKPKKSFDPLPYVEEVENNSSPIKKPTLALRSSGRSKRAIPVSKKLHRVSFGPNLSPEQFLRSLPPNTPVKKGATPARLVRKSPTAKRSSPRAKVAETGPKTFKSPVSRSSPQMYKKVDRTPTPFKPDPKKLKGKPLLQQVLHASIASNKRLEQNSSSPELAKKRKSEVASLEKTASGSAKKAKPSPKLHRNTPIVNIHKTANNLHRRSVRSSTKPLWSEVVKRPAKRKVGAKVASKKPASKVMKAKKPVTSNDGLAAQSGHHVDSPATIYISRTRSRIQPTKTPKPIKTAAPAKLDLPSNEDFTGMTELFATPSNPRESFKDEESCLDLLTPKSVGEMIVSPMSDGDRSRYSLSVENANFENGASPQFRKTRRSAVAEKDEQNMGLRRLMKTPKEKMSPAVEDHFGTKRLMQTPKEKKVSSPAVKEHFGTKRLMKTPREPKSQPIEENFGTKRVFKTPRGEKSQPVEENFGTKRVFKMPRGEKSQPVEENFGTKRVFKTPRGEKSQPVEENFGTKRVFKTPRGEKSQPVEENFGTKRVFKTPRGEKSQPVEENFGTKRVFKTPRGEKSQPVEENFGTKRVFKTPRREKSQSVEENFGTKRVFKTPRGEKSQPVEENFGTKRVFKTPRGEKSQPVEKKFGLGQLFHQTNGYQKSTSAHEVDDFHLDLLYSEPPETEKTPLASSKPTPNRGTRNSSRNTKTPTTKMDAPPTDVDVTTPKRRGRSKKNAEIATQSHKLVTAVENSMDSEDSSVAVKEKAPIHPHVRRAKSATAKPASPKNHVKKVVIDEIAPKLQKHVSFHASVQSSIVKDYKGAEKASTSARLTRKRGVAAVEKVTAVPVSRGRGKKAVESIDAVLDKEAEGAKTAKKRKLSKKEVDSNKSDAKAISEEQVEQNISAVKPSTRTTRRRANSQKDEVNEVSGAQPTRNIRSKASARKDEAINKPVTSEIIVKPVRSSRRGKVEEAEKVQDISKSESNPAEVETIKPVRASRRGQVEREVMMQGVALEEAESVSSQSSDASTASRNSRSKKTSKKQEEKAMPDQTVASVKPVRASRRRGKAEDDAEIKDVPSADEASVSSQASIGRSTGKGTRSKAKQQKEEVTLEEPSKIESKPVRRTARRGKVMEKMEPQQSADEASVSSQASAGSGTGKGTRSKAKQKKEVTLEPAEIEIKPVKTGRSGKVAKNVVPQKSTGDETPSSQSSESSTRSTRSKKLEEKAPAPAASNKSKPTKRKLTQKQPEVEEKKSSANLISEVEAAVPAKRSKRAKKGVEKDDEPVVQNTDEGLRTTRGSRSKIAQQKEEEEKETKTVSTTRSTRSKKR